MAMTSRRPRASILVVFGNRRGLRLWRLDVQEVDETPESLAMILLIYTYDVAGVTYEASQDVTRLRQFLDLYSCRLGLHASVKYDPHNPGDSIVISETWSGLRESPIRMRPRTVAS